MLIKKIRLLIATSNLKKLKECQEILAGLPIRCLSLQDFPNCREVPETGRTFEENAKIKALGYAEQTGMLTLGEDSGLCCRALDGAPGVFSARFSGAGKNDDANNAKLIERLKEVPDNERGAFYESAIAFAEPDKLIGVVKGQVHGFIARELQGAEGFGYDPLFYYPPYRKTFGEVPPVMKHRVSHRGKAFAKAKILLRKYIASIGR